MRAHGEHLFYQILFPRERLTLLKILLKVQFSASLMKPLLNASSDSFQLFTYLIACIWLFLLNFSALTILLFRIFTQIENHEIVKCFVFSLLVFLYI